MLRDDINEPPSDESSDNEIEAAPSKTRVVVNVGTDTGTYFEVGNTFVSSPDPGAMAFNIVVGVIAANARTASELVNQDMESPYPAWFNKFAGNLGASLIVSGTGLVVSSVSKGIESGWSVDFQSDWSQPAIVSPSVILLSFGLANGARGLAYGLRKGGISQKFLDSAGIAIATFGVLTSVPDSPVIVKGLLAGAAVLETASALGAKVPNGAPDAIFAIGCFGNAIDAYSNGNNQMAIANTFFGFAFMSLGALKRSGGVFQLFKRNKSEPPAPTLEELTP